MSGCETGSEDPGTSGADEEICIGGRAPHWSPVREKPYWPPRHEVDPRGMVEHRHKYEQPPRPEPRPKIYPKAKVESKPMQRNLTVVPTKAGAEEKPRVRPKQAEVKPKAVVEKKTTPHVEATVAPPAKEQDEKQPQDSGTTKKTVEAGPSSDSNAASTEGYYELSPLMSRMLNSELEDIMIKVWQELPDNPTNEAEKLVVNKLRNKADDDLRNVFGLNVSKRLLNVFNVMCIKMKFTSKPDGQELAKFLKRNDISNFKWNNIKPLTYTAVVRNVKDFDYLCATQKFHIGNVKVLITPIYQFTKCPPKLRTSYHVTNFRSMNVQTNISNDKPTETAKTADQTNATDAKPSKDTVVDNPPPNVTKETVKTDKDTKETKEATKDTVVKTSPKVVEKQTKVTPEKKATIAKPTSKEKQKVAAKKIETKVVKKEPVKKKIIDKKQKPLGRSILEAGNDFDELDDDEIMALVNQGIVLDECSGSDEEI